MMSRKQFMADAFGFTAGVVSLDGFARAARAADSAGEPETAVAFAPLAPARLAEIAAMLPEAPRGFGPRCPDDRAAWDALRARPLFAAIIPKAERLLTAPFPAWSDEDYLDFSRSGQRPRGEKMIGARHAFLAPLVWAECLENKGRFVARIETVLRGYAAEPTWTLPAHDGDLKSFHGTSYFVDLGASMFGSDLAQALYLLGDILSADVRDLVQGAIEARVLAPVRESYKTGSGHWWLTGTNNWNAVCLSGVTHTALCTLPGRDDRAFFSAGAERYSRNSIAGFSDDGYCIEGLGYYNYGFSHYILLRDTLWRATAGKLDLFADPKIRKIATYGPRFEIINDTWPAIGDSHPGLRADGEILAYCGRTLGLDLWPAGKPEPVGLDTLFRGSMEAFPAATPVAGQRSSSSSAAEEIGVRSYFQDAGLLVVRPASGSACRIGVAMKAGHNFGSHTHNDTGSFTIVLGKEPIIGDPGGPNFYNSKTFGPERYTAFKLYASYGHPVPLIAGKQQRYADSAAARVLRNEPTGSADHFALDLVATYPPGTVEKLVRTFDYDRAGAGTLTITDDFAFPGGTPQSFESALTTRAEWKQTTHDTLTFTQGAETIVATITTPAGAGGFTVVSDRIVEDCEPFTRLGLRLNTPVAAGQVTITFRPA